MEWSEGDPQMARQAQVVIVDSSVVVKWFSEEERTDKALGLRDLHVSGRIAIWVSPSSYFEIANALRFKPDYDEEKLSKAMGHLLNLHLESAHVDRKLLSRTGEIAYDGGVTIYDAAPVALAEEKKAFCVTDDKVTQYAKLEPRGYPIRLLHNIESPASSNMKQLPWTTPVSANIQDKCRSAGLNQEVRHASARAFRC